MFISLIGGFANFGIMLVWFAYILLPSGKVYNIYVDIIFGGALEIVSMIFLNLLINRMPRKMLLSLLLGLQATIILASVILRSLSNGE